MGLSSITYGADNTFSRHYHLALAYLELYPLRDTESKFVFSNLPVDDSDVDKLLVHSEAAFPTPTYFLQG